MRTAAHTIKVMQAIQYEKFFLSLQLSTESVPKPDQLRSKHDFLYI